MENQPSFTNRVVVVATMHQKERAIAPILEQELNVKAIVPSNFDTDRFGTFTRDIKRRGTQIEAARFKVEAALALTGETLAVASEGTFAPHPAVPYLSYNREIVLFLDKQNNLEIIGEELSLETNHNAQTVETLEEAYNFAKKVGFPEHGLVVMFDESSKNSREIIKGITTEEKLTEAVTFVLKNSRQKKAYIETDMRAMYNPTRLKNIEKATRDLVKKIKSLCPECAWPGFSVTERKKGLPCEMCRLPTPLTLAAIYQCKKCGFSKQELFPDGKKYADPMQCMYCNP